MPAVCLRSVTPTNFQACLRLEVAPGQEGFVAPNVYSLAQAKVNPLLTPWAAYDRQVLGRDPGPDEPMVEDEKETYLLLDWPEGTVDLVRGPYPRG